MSSRSSRNGSSSQDPAASGVEEHSVLARLSVDGHLQPPLLLTDPLEDEGSPLVAPVSRREGRYQVLGEIARGGVGVVLRGHDVDLGRTLAMKVLREEFADDPDVLQRFVEEAQIGGQLQHPGIVPVYEMGLGEDGRPYFTMKLVKGQTLAALLKDADKHGGRRGLVKVFESVCQTIAYAHARDVIHRDLKPANIMVGAFGEVLVVDWGMGKVLRAQDGESPAVTDSTDRSLIATLRSGSGSESIVGSVMGTPNYMPPEQARGEIAAVDKRSDVFALGAILCEILTGKPPYAGTNKQAFVLASRGDLAQATARLDACDADDELVSLARDCLAPAPMARPEDAGDVAARVGRYLAGLQQAARTAREEAAEARVHAEGERRRRRLTLGLAGSIAALLLIVGAGWSFLRSAGEERRKETARLVSEALDEAVRLEGEALAAQDVAAFDRALDATRRAQTLVASEAGDALRARVRDVVAAIEDGRRAAEEAAEVRRGDEAMVRRLDRIRAAFITDRNVAQTLRDYEDAFRDYGMDLQEHSALEIRERIDGSAIRDELLDGFNLWAGRDILRVLTGGRDVGYAKMRELTSTKRSYPVFDVYVQVDPDPWRLEVRSVQTLEELLALAEADDVLDRRPLDVESLIERLMLSGEVGAARGLARRLIERHPDSFWLHVDLAAFYQNPPILYAAAIRHLTAAVALRPDASEIRAHLADLLGNMGRAEEARAQLAQALRVTPDNSRARAAFVRAHVSLGDHEAAERLGRAFVRDAPEDFRAHSALGVVLSIVGRPDEAIEHLERAAELNDLDIGTWGALCGAYRQAYRFEDAARAVKWGLSLEPRSGYLLSELGDVEIGRRDFQAAREAFETAISLDASQPSFHASLGQVLLQLEESEAAERAARRALEMEPGFYRGTDTVSRKRTLFTAHKVIATVVRMRGDLAGAERHLRSALENAHVDGMRAAVLCDLGFVVAAQGDAEQAHALRHEAQRLAPKDPAVARFQGTILMTLAEHEKAARAFERARELEPLPPLVHFYWGSSLVNAGEYPAALGVLSVSVEQRPDDPRAHNFLGLALMQAGRSQEALDACNAGLALAPNDPYLRNLRCQMLIRVFRYDDAEKEIERVAASITDLPPKQQAEIKADVSMYRGQLATSRRAELFLAGKLEPASIEEELVFAGHAVQKGDPEHALAMYESIFKRAPAQEQDIQGGWRLGAAMAAVGAGELDKAWHWITRELDAAAGLLDKGAVMRRSARTHLYRILVNHFLAPVREPDQLAKLPPEERKRWSALWQKLRDRLAK